jgi:cobaltochelatase CobT
VTIVDAEELGGAITEKLAELFDEHQAAEPQRGPARRPAAWSRAAAAVLERPAGRRA